MIWTFSFLAAGIIVGIGIIVVGLYVRGSATNNRVDSLSESVRSIRSQLIKACKERDSLRRPTLRNRELMRATDDIEAGTLRNGS